MIEFRQKDFSRNSIIRSTIAGAGAGAAVGTLGTSFFKKNPRNPRSEGFDPASKAIYTTGGLIVGAALGAMIGLIDDFSDRINKKTTLNNRLMKSVVDNLKRAGLKEGFDFTQDPKRSSELKTRVAICISKVSGDLKILINITSDQKLKDLTRDMVKNIPNTSAVSENMSDRFNTITITTISDSSADAGLITGIAERYIHSGYPVQLVEVG